MSGSVRNQAIAPLAVVALLLGAGVAAAGEPPAPAAPGAGQQDAAQDEYEGMRDPGLMAEDTEFRRFRSGAFGGRLSGGTASGSAENLFLRATFEQGSDTLWGGRAAYGFLPRFDVELELGQASPGLTAVLTDLNGRGATDVPYADLRLRYVSTSVLYHMVDRERLFVPFLALGPALVSASSDQEPVIDDTAFGLLFGGGLRVRPLETVSLRADVRGLRSTFGGDEAPDGVPGVLVGDFSGTNLLWSVGVDVHF